MQYLLVFHFAEATVLSEIWSTAAAHRAIYGNA